jgi:hypothetical protein
MSRDTYIFRGLVALIAGLVVLLYGVYRSASGECLNVADCIRVLVYGAPYQYYALPAVSLLLSILPLLVARHSVYVAWRKFAVVAVPVFVLLILLAPSHGSGTMIPMDLTRELSAILWSGLFLAVSWVLIAYKSFCSKPH